MPRTLTNTITERVNELLDAHKKSKRALARETQLSNSVLSELLNYDERRRWNSEAMQSVAKALQIDPWKLCVKDPEAVFPQVAKDLYEAYRKLSVAEQAMVDRLLFATEVSKPTEGGLSKLPDEVKEALN